MPPRPSAASKVLTHGVPVLAIVCAGFAGLVRLQSGKLEIRVRERGGERWMGGALSSEKGRSRRR